MSSSRRTEDGPQRRVRGKSLRTRLIAVLVAALAVVCLIVGVVTELALNAFLVGQLDSQLAADSERVARSTGPRPGDGPDGPGRQPGAPGPRPGEARGLAPGAITAVIADRRVERAELQSAQAEPEPLASRWNDELLSLPRDGQAHTRDLGELGVYRLTTTSTPTGHVVVTGLPLTSVRETLLSVGFILAGVSITGLLITGVSGALIVRRTLRPLERMADTATEVTALSLDRGAVDLAVRVPEPDADLSTEVGRVGAALNRMLGHVGDALTARHASESRVRQFVADASHELRTPLASIRGYAELTRRHGDTVPPDVSHAMRRVEAESERMATLVEELLLLARLDSGRPVVHEPVDLSRLVADALSDARVSGPEHRWLLDAPAEPITVLGDAAALHQVVANLLHNARTHTPAGTTVRTTLSTVDGSVRLAVTDDGPGIPADVLPEVFERFARAGISRSRAAGSTGLGLAIVRAVVAAHGGDVAVHSRPGHTEFTVNLPGGP